MLPIDVIVSSEREMKSNEKVKYNTLQVIWLNSVYDNLLFIDNKLNITHRQLLFLVTKVSKSLNVMHCAIWYHLWELKNAKKAKACNFNKSNIPPWVFFMLLKLYKRYQITQSISNIITLNSLRKGHSLSIPQANTKKYRTESVMKNFTGVLNYWKHFYIMLHVITISLFHDGDKTCTWYSRKFFLKNFVLAQKRGEK